MREFMLSLFALSDFGSIADVNVLKPGRRNVGVHVHKGAFVFCAHSIRYFEMGEFRKIYRFN